MGLFKKLRKKIESKITREGVLASIPELNLIVYNCKRVKEMIDASWFIVNNDVDNEISSKARLFPPYHVMNTKIGDYSYVSINSYISNTIIGKCSSLGPNLLCGWGIHPTNAISTSPMFYSKNKQNGTTLTKKNKIEERKTITIGNDVFIGANVIVLDGVTIGDGAIIGAGAVVNKDIPPYAIAVGCPIKIIKYRFDEETIKRIRETQWWDWDEKKLSLVEKNFFDIEIFLALAEKEK